MILHGLQTTFFITLGRLFDANSDALSLHTFLNECESNLDQFSRASLKRRRIKMFGNEPDWLDAYVKEKYEPTREDFRAIKRAARPHKKKYESIYRDIRNKVIAHKELATLDGHDGLYARTQVRDLEAALLFLNQVTTVVRELLQNGRLIALPTPKVQYEREVVADAANMVERLRH